MFREAQDRLGENETETRSSFQTIHERSLGEVSSSVNVEQRVQ